MRRSPWLRPDPTAGEVRNVSLLVAIGVNAKGYRGILGIVEGAKEDKAGWSAFLKHLKQRGLSGVECRRTDHDNKVDIAVAMDMRRGRSNKPQERE